MKNEPIWQPGLDSDPKRLWMLPVLVNTPSPPHHLVFPNYYTQTCVNVFSTPQLPDGSVVYRLSAPSCSFILIAPILSLGRGAQTFARGFPSTFASVSSPDRDTKKKKEMHHMYK